MKYVGYALGLGLLITAACRTAPPVEEEPTHQDVPEDAAAHAAELDAEDLRSASEFLRSEAELFALQTQMRRVLLDQHLATAERLKGELRFEEAERETLRALEIERDSPEALNLLAELRGLMGRDPGVATALLEDLGRSYEIKRQQLRAEAEDLVRRAERMLMRGEYDSAITEAQLALDSVRWAPVTLDWQGVDQRAADVLERARAERERATRTQREEAERAALDALRREEQQARQRREARVLNLIDQAIAAFEAEAYDTAMELADRALREDPRNERAREVRESAFRAGREKVRSDFVLEKRERFRRWQQEIYSLRIPINETITLPDEDDWARITELRGRRQGLAIQRTASPEDQALRETVRTRRLPALIVRDEESLTRVVAGLYAMTGLPFVVDPLAEEAAFAEGANFDFNLTNPITVERALNLITQQAGEEVTWTVQLEAILVTTNSRARGELVFKSHDVQDLLFPLTNFLGQRIDRLRLIDDLMDDDDGGPFGGLSEPTVLMQPDDLVDLVRDNVAVGTWDDDGISLMALDSGNLMVKHTPDVQLQVVRFLEDLRRFNTSLVTIDSKFLKIADNFIQEIGVEWRGIDNPGVPFTDLNAVTSGLEDNASLGLDNLGTGVGGGNDAGPPSAGFFYDDGNKGDFKAHTSHIFGSPLGNALSTIGGLTTQFSFLDNIQLSIILRAVEKSQQIELVNTQTVSVYNTQRAYVSVINQRAYIQDFDVEVAQLAAIADPVINVLHEGVVLEVRPTIQHDRKYIALELQPTVARVVALRDFATALGGTTLAPVEFQLPELEVESVSTTVVVPDGGSILLGGLSRVRNIERRAEVPWLANIPLLGFFFKREGYNDEKSSLMILLRAAITDVQEEVARMERRSR